MQPQIRVARPQAGEYVIPRAKEAHMSFTLYLVGFIILILGLAWGANLMHVPPRWIGVGVIVMAGLGILSAVSTTRRRDPE
jgi:uncharacterized membrane protein YiaA